MKLVVDGFPNGGMIPEALTCDGDGFAPAVEWSGEPRGTESFALVVEDPDAPGGTWYHWLLWDIPAHIRSLPPNFQATGSICHGTNDFHRLGYGGPCPPEGHSAHRYVFRLFALDCASLHLASGANYKNLHKVLRSHVLAEVQYLGRYERKRPRVGQSREHLGEVTQAGASTPVTRPPVR
jgi:Raf kinase inhibitor-like YbhB/YbcL family protein